MKASPVLLPGALQDRLGANGVIVLVLVYAKAKFDNIRPEVLRRIKEKFDV